MTLLPKLLKISRVFTIMFVIVSAYFSINAMFIDFETPGSPVAQKLSTWANYLFSFTLICTLPLLYEKYKMLSAWEDKFELANKSEKNKMIWIVLKPMIRGVIGVVVMTIIAIILIQIFHPISPEQIANYQAYYSQPKPISYP